MLDALVAWQVQELEAGGGDFRPVPRPNLHVTLAFLGWWPAERVEEVTETLRRRAGRIEPPVFTARRYRETRSVGMVVLSEDRGASRLAYGLQRDLLGEVERRPWLPHVTVVRFRSRPRLEPQLPDLPPFRTSDAAVYHSVLRPAGAQYEVLETVALGGS